MKREFVIPSRDISRDLTVYCQWLGFNIEKVYRSVLGRARFIIEKKGCRLCIEDYIDEPYAPEHPYLEIVVTTSTDYEELLDDLCLNTKLIFFNRESFDDNHPITILRDIGEEMLKLQIIYEYGVKKDTHISGPSEEDEIDEKE